MQTDNKKAFCVKQLLAVRQPRVAVVRNRVEQQL